MWLSKWSEAVVSVITKGYKQTRIPAKLARASGPCQVHRSFFSVTRLNNRPLILFFRPFSLGRTPYVETVSKWGTDRAEFPMSVGRHLLSFSASDGFSISVRGTEYWQSFVSLVGYVSGFLVGRWRDPTGGFGRAVISAGPLTNLLSVRSSCQ